MNAAIEYLENAVRWGYSRELRESADKAIRVLEAAGKVHKNDAIMAFGNAIGYLDDMINLDERGEEDVRAVFALLEALPEEEK